MSGQGDLWHRWLLERRFGGDERLAERMLGNVMKLRDNAGSG